MAIAGHVYDPFTNLIHWIGESPSVGTNEETNGLIAEDFRPSALPETGVVGNTIFRQGGNVHRIRVEGRLNRANMGDGEAWAYVTLRNLGATGLSTLSVNSKSYTDVYFTSGTATLKKTSGGCLIGYQMEFVRSLPFHANLLTPTIDPIGFGTFPGRVSTGNYAMVDFSNPFFTQTITLGAYAEIRRVTVRRPVLTKKIPRSYGAIIEPLKSGREMTLQVTTFLHPDVGGMQSGSTTDRAQQRGVLENEIQFFEWNLRDRVFSLIGNGNWFLGVHVRRIQPQHSDNIYSAAISLDCVQELPFTF